MKKAKKPIRFKAELPLLITSTRYLKVHPAIWHCLRDECKVRGGDYALVVTEPYANPAIERVRAKLKRYRISYTEQRSDTHIRFSTQEASHGN